MVGQNKYCIVVKGYLRVSGGRRIISPLGLDTRPTSSLVRESVMNILAREVNGSNWLDLCSGTGSMGCEAIIRGARRVVAIEKDKNKAKVCETNLNSINNSFKEEVEIKVIHQEVIKWLSRGFKKSKSFLDKNDKFNSFDIVYVDPPYEAKLYYPILMKLLEGKWLNQKSIVICEHSTKNGITAPEKWRELKRRNYGKTSLLLISPQENYFDDIGSMHQQTSQG